MNGAALGTVEAELRHGCTPGGLRLCNHLTQSDEDALIVHRGERAYVVLNLYPFGSGHLMIVPFRHVAAPRDLEAEERAELWELLDRSLGRSSRRSARRATTSASTSARPPAPASPTTSTCTSCRAGRATTTSCRCSPTSASCRSTWPKRVRRSSLRGPPKRRPPYHWAHDAGSFGLQGLRRPWHRPGRARRRRRVPHRPRVRGRVRAAHDGDRARHAADLAGAVRGRRARRARRRAATSTTSASSAPRCSISPSASTATRAASSSRPRTTRSSTTA